MVILVGGLNDTARPTVTGVAGLLGQLVSTSAQVVFQRVHDEGASNDASGSGQGKLSVGYVDLGTAVRVGLDVAEVTGVTLFVVLGTVGFLKI